MSNDNVPPAIKEIVVAKPDRRLKEVERRLSGGGVAADAVVPGGDRFPGYSFPLATVGDLAPLWKASRDIAYVSAVINCCTPGGGTATFDLEVDGSVVLSLSLLTGEQTHAYTAVFSIANGQFFGGTLSAVAGQAVISVQLVEAA